MTTIALSLVMVDKGIYFSKYAILYRVILGYSLVLNK